MEPDNVIVCPEIVTVEIIADCVIVVKDPGISDVIVGPETV